MNSTQNAKFLKLVREQSGVISREQATELKLTVGQWRTFTRSKAWEKAGTGVIRVAASQLSWEQRVWIACLETGGHASHKTAGWLFRLDGLGKSAPRELDVVVKIDNQRTTNRAKVHRSRTLTDAHLAKPKGIPRTTLARTLVDLAEVLSEGDFEDAYDSAVRKEPTTPAEVKELLKTLPRRGQQGIGMLKSLLDENLRAVDSALEVKVRRLIRKNKLPAPEEGVPLFDGNEIIGRLDFAWPNNRPRVAVMAHGAKYHQKNRRWHKDNDQYGELSSMGWRVVPCSMVHVEDPDAREQFLKRLKRSLAGFESAAEFKD
ncbi:MAG: hypothetical protein QM723_14600 [Myxococcaceae bacterium]